MAASIHAIQRERRHEAFEELRLGRSSGGLLLLDPGYPLGECAAQLAGVMF